MTASPVVSDRAGPNHAPMTSPNPVPSHGYLALVFGGKWVPAVPPAGRTRYGTTGDRWS